MSEFLKSRNFALLLMLAAFLAFLCFLAFGCPDPVSIKYAYLAFRAFIFGMR